MLHLRHAYGLSKTKEFININSALLPNLPF
jgi:hypothetical protein